MCYLLYFYKMWRKKIAVVFISLTVINIIVFLCRDYFQYQSYSDYQALYGTCPKNCIDKWKKFVADYPGREMIQTKALTDSLLSGTLSSYDKTKQLANFIYNRFHAQEGKPAPDLNTSSPFVQYQKLSLKDSEKLWCGNYALIFAWFCWSQNIPCRIIEIMKPGDHHVLNECYIAETGRWILIDLTYNIPGIRGKNDSLLNFQELKQALKQNQDLTIFRNSGPVVLDRHKIFHHYLNDYPAYYYYRVNNEKVYSTMDKVKRYFLPVSWYEIYKENPGVNLVFYLKPVLFVLWIVSFFVFINCRTKFKA